MWHQSSSRTKAEGIAGRRRRWRRAGGLTAVVAASALTLAACGGGSSSGSTGSPSAGSSATGTGGASSSALAKFQQNGINIGFANEKPYDYQDASGNITGEAPTLAKAILSKLGITKLNYKLVKFDALIPGLKANRFDMTAAAASITPKRAKQVLYSDPGYCVHEALGVKKGNPLGLSDYKSVKNNPKATLAVESGATEEKFAKQIGIPSSQLLTVSNNQELVAAVKGGRADAFSLTGITVRSLVKTSGDGQLEALKGFNPVINGKPQVSCGGFQFRKDETALRDAFTKELHKLQKADKVYPLVKQFGFGKDQIEEAKKHTAAELGKTTAG